MNKPFEFRVSGYSDCADALIDFRNRNRESTRDRAYFDWRYLDRPCSLEPVIVWAYQAGDPVGALTLFPHDFFIVDGEYSVGVVGDVSVQEEFRGHGLAVSMLRVLAQNATVQKLKGGVVLPNLAASRSFAKAQWRDQDRILRFAKPLRFGPRLKRIFKSNAVAEVLATPLDLATRLLSHESRYDANGYRADLLQSVDARFDVLWESAAKQGRIVGLRNGRYLRWRYQTHPLHRYRVLAITADGALRGYAMYHESDGVAFVDDVFCESPERDATHVVGLLMRHLREHATASVSVSINDGAFKFPWKKFGFVARPDYQGVMALNLPTSPAWHLTAGDKDV